MESVSVGRTGLKVSRLAIGCMNFGSEVTEVEATEILDTAADFGIYFVDTANVYPVPPCGKTWGMSETIVGRWLKGRRDSVVLSSKCGNRVGEGANDIGGSRKHIIKACEDSLRRLGTDYLDTYYLHKPELYAPIDESLEAMDRLIQDGKILYFGLSKFAPWQLAIALDTIAGGRLAKVAVIQDRYSLVARTAEHDLLPLAKATGMGFVAYGPLGGGLLAGAMRRGDVPPEAGRFTMKLYQDRYLREEVFELADTLKQIAAGLGVSAAQLALAWVLHNDAGIIPLIGALKADHVKDCVKALAIEISPKTLAQLNQLSECYLNPQTAL